MMIDNNDNNSSGNNGNKGKFSERLKKMRRDRLKLRKKGTLEDDVENDKLTLRTAGRNIFKIVLALPAVIYTNIIDTNKKNTNKNTIDKEQNDVLLENISVVELTDEIPVSVEREIVEIDKKIKVNKIKEMDVSLLKKKREYLLSKVGYFNTSKVDKTVNNVEMELRKTKLQKEIIDLIKKKLVKNVNELEMLQSELYVLNQMELGETYLGECEQDIKEVKRLLSKVKALKERYDYLKDNVDFQYMLEYEDELLIDKILELKEICSRDDIRQTIEDYKILDEYKYLYLKIDKLQEETIKLEEYKGKKVEELKERDIDFDKFKNDIYDVDIDSERYDNFVKNQ